MTRPHPDEELAAVVEALAPHREHSPLARIDAFRRADLTDVIRVRVIDPLFEGELLTDRADRLSELLSKLPAALDDKISVLALTPEEADAWAVEDSAAGEAGPWERPDGRFKLGEYDIGGTKVYAVAVEPSEAVPAVVPEYQGFLKLDRPPGVGEVDEALSILQGRCTEDRGWFSLDLGELLRDEHFHPRRFPTADAAIEAAFAEAERRLELHAARRQSAPPVSSEPVSSGTESVAA